MYLDTVYHVCVGGGFWDFSRFSLECQFDDVYSHVLSHDSNWNFAE